MTSNSFTNFLALSPILTPENLYEVRISNSMTGKVEYIGQAVTPNANTALPIWNIRKVSYDGNGFTSRVQLPDDGPGFLYIWDNVASYFS